MRRLGALLPILVLMLLTFTGSTGAAHAAQFSLCGPSGGVGGNEYDDGQTGGRKVKELRISSGAFIDSIQIIWVGQGSQTIPGAKHGGAGGTLKVFTLAPDEYITRVGGKYGWYIDSLYVVTNKNRSMKWGGSGGDVDFIYSAPPGTTINGFFGRAGKYVDSLGVIMKTE